MNWAYTLHSTHAHTHCAAKTAFNRRLSVKKHLAGQPTLCLLIAPLSLFYAAAAAAALAVIVAVVVVVGFFYFIS